MTTKNSYVNVNPYKLKLYDFLDLKLNLLFPPSPVIEDVFFNTKFKKKLC